MVVLVLVVVLWGVVVMVQGVLGGLDVGVRLHQ